jgi:hypothetical protein
MERLERSDVPDERVLELGLDITPQQVRVKVRYFCHLLPFTFALKRTCQMNPSPEELGRCYPVGSVISLTLSRAAFLTARGMIPVYVRVS